MTKENEQEPKKLSDDEIILLQVVAFKKIYSALHHAQPNSNALKTNFIFSYYVEQRRVAPFIAKVREHAQEAPTSRTAQAWDLTQKYYLDCHDANPELVNEIVKYATQNTRYLGVRWFSSLVSIPSFTKEQVETREYADNNSQGWGIAYYLKKKVEISDLLNKGEDAARMDRSDLLYR